MRKLRNVIGANGSYAGNMGGRGGGNGAAELINAAANVVCRDGDKKFFSQWDGPQIMDADGNAGGDAAALRQINAEGSHGKIGSCTQNPSVNNYYGVACPLFCAESQCTAFLLPIGADKAGRKHSIKAAALLFLNALHQHFNGLFYPFLGKIFGLHG